jgi:AcrR family transcriptional regulator
VNELTDRRREEKDRRRNELLDAAAVVATESGFDAISMDLVAKQARLSRALVYVYFEDKDALQLALCARSLELLQERFAIATQDARTGRDRLAAMGAAYVSFSQELPVYFEALARFEARNAEDLQQGDSRCLELGDACHDHLTAATKGALLTHRGTSAPELFEHALALTLRSLGPTT